MPIKMYHKKLYQINEHSCVQEVKEAGDEASVVKHLLSMCKALGSISNNRKKTKKLKEH
jgi:hypothetical protein